MSGGLSQVPVFGLRHLSPGVAWHLRRYLDERRPRWLLIEGPSDMNAMVEFITDKHCKPPFAALAFTTAIPVEMLLYPFAAYSPEYQAALWVKTRRAQVRFIDLPSGIFLGLELERKKRLLAALTAPAKEEESSGEEANAPAFGDADIRFDWARRHIAECHGEFDYDSYWEGNFEAPLEAGPYREAMMELGMTIRECEPGRGRFGAETLVREAYMRRCILQLLVQGVPPSDIVVIVGAYHAPVINDDHAPISDSELESLPVAPSNFTLMPYSYQRLSSQSDYGAGNAAPAYYQLLWESLQAGSHDSFPSRYLSHIARDLRERGTFRSTAEVIEGTRLAHSLAAMHDRAHPVKAELRDAAITLLGQGEFAAVADAMHKIDIGNEIGALPPGVGQTSIQDDFQREMLRLRLEKFRTTDRQELQLDLRENRRAGSEKTAYLDLNRSSFLHRLGLLSISFATRERSRQDSATWAEKWTLEWKPEAEIALVEAVLMGETIELPAAHALQRKLVEATRVQEAACLIRLAGECAMPTMMGRARLALRDIAARAPQFQDLAFAARELAFIVRYGDVRRLVVEPLKPVIEQLFHEAVLQLLPSANCDAATAVICVEAMEQLNAISIEYSMLVDEKLWESTLLELSNADVHNPVLSGFACAILLERGLISDEMLAMELSRRLSPGIDAELGAGWFEGLSRRNRYALLSRLSLWRHLESYISSLSEDEFKRALVFIRRSLESFNGHERRQIAENLGEIWGVHRDSAAVAIEAELTEEEADELKELTEMDFGDL